MSYTVLIIDDEENARQNISIYLQKSGYEVFEAGSIKEGREQLAQGNGDIVILDVQLPDGLGIDFLTEITAMPAKPPVILITGYGDIQMAVEAMKNGAHDFLTKPIMDMETLKNSISRATEIIQMRRELNLFRQNQKKMYDFVVGNSPKAKILMEQAERAAAGSASVLITGETGTGKEVLAHFIHQSGPRAQKPFMAINCAAIQQTLLESELFGHEPGAFSSADKKKNGLMEDADGGILFLDEISSMPTDIQAKLLRAIESGEFRRVGGNKLIKVDVEVVAASNRNIPAMIKEEKFREDLYYRLKVVDLNLLPLRDRKEDIPELIGFFINKYNMQMGKNVLNIAPDAQEVLIKYQWPGNIRELSNVIQRAMLFCDGETIALGDLPLDITRKED